MGKSKFFTIDWQHGKVVMLDQRLLPQHKRYREYKDYRGVAKAIKDMVIRGAPAIGVAAAMGIVLGVRQLKRGAEAGEFDRLCKVFEGTRPTAVNLFWAVNRMRASFGKARPRGRDFVLRALEREALKIYKEDLRTNRSLGRHGATLIPEGARSLTLCNAGALATAGYGTALGIIRAAAQKRNRVSVWVPETRPYLQGSRLTAWELTQEQIPMTLITDNMIGYFMQKGVVDCVVVGTDRTAANGDVANKIGTYTSAVLAARHGIPFYVAAPTTSIDLDCASGAEIAIEQRAAKEITHLAGHRIAPSDVCVEHPAFDVTPTDLVTAIITENGIARAPFSKSLPRIMGLS